MKFETKSIHAIPVDPLTGAISTPIYQTSTYEQEAPGVNKGFDYTRTSNPTRLTLENLLAQLEGGVRGLAFSSGLAAVDAVAKLLNYGDEVLAVDDIYGGTFRTFTQIFSRFGVKIRFVDTSDVQAVADAITPQTKLIWLESPTNPTLKISDIAAISAIASGHGIKVVVDNTFCTPYLQRPLELGADIVLHSATKYLAGHSDVIAGALVVKDPELADQLKYIQNTSGAILAPFDSWLTIRGIETLQLRVDKHCQNAQKIAEFLRTCPEIDQVFYPGLPSHKNYHIAKKQQSQFGGVISFTLKNDTAENATKICTSTTYFKLAESLGGVKSLICHPAAMTHKSTPAEVRQAAGVKDSLVRLSVGIEHADDLVEDLAKAILVFNKEFILS